MVDASTFGLKPDFPIASVADLYAKKPYLESLMNQAQQGQLVNGMQTLGAGLQSLAQRKMMMAQALAASRMYAATPEGQQMLGTNRVASGPGGQPVLQGQIASGGVGQAPVPNAPQVAPSDIATAMYGESPSNMMTQMFERQKLSQEMGLKEREQALKEKIEPQKLSLENQIQGMLAGIKGQEAATGAAKASSGDIDTLLQRRIELQKLLPTNIFGWESDQAKEAKLQIAQIDAQLASKGYKTSGGATGGWISTPKGGKYTVNP